MALWCNHSLSPKFWASALPSGRKGSWIRPSPPGLPKRALERLSSRLYADERAASAYKFKVVPQATWKRRTTRLSVDESERTERLARLLAHAEYVWDDLEQARAWMSKPHCELDGRAPLDVATTELGARRVETLLDRLFFGLPRLTMFAYRIADARHPIYYGTGALLHGARWNSAGRPVIYAAESFAGAMLELLVHANLGAPPKHHQVVRITIPDDVPVETLHPEALDGWDGGDLSVPRTFGDQWLREARSAVLRVPSVVTDGREHNILINPLHPEAARLHVTAPEPVRWDARLFARG